jgi:membrane-associated HD superfamily phosphohydrolase
MKKNKLPIIAILLSLSIVNFSRMKGLENVRAVEFISIFVIGLLSGILLVGLIDKFKNKV